jgi:hypothetical protein
MADILQVGEWNEEGLLNSLTREGFTKLNSLFELFANSIDASATHIHTTITDAEIIFVDDGRGMSREKVKGMFNMCYSNHRNDETMGISGKGAKGAQIELTNKGIVTMFSYDGEEYIKIIVDWGKIFQNKTVKEQIKIVSLTPEEISKFTHERKNMTKQTGLTCIIENNGENAQTIRGQFDDNVYKKLPRKQRTDVVFGKFGSVKFTMNDQVNGCWYSPLNPYNPLELNGDQYYFNEEDEIEVYQNKSDKNKLMFCLKDKEGPPKYKTYEKKKINFGISEKYYNDFPEKEYDFIGTFSIKTQLHRNRNLFDYNNPKNILSTDEKKKLKTNGNDEQLIKSIEYKPAKDIGQCISPYHKEYFNTENNWQEHCTDMCQCGIYRNGQFIGQKSIVDNGATWRGSTKSLIGGVFIQTTIQYNVKCDQTNIKDKIIGVQGVKAQLSECGFPREFTGLLTNIRNNCKDKIFSEWDDKIKIQTRREEQIKVLRRKLITKLAFTEWNDTIKDHTSSKPIVVSSPPLRTGEQCQGVEETKGEQCQGVEETKGEESGDEESGDEESGDEESGDEESSDEESGDEESSVIENDDGCRMSDNKDLRINNLTIDIENILSNMKAMQGCSQEVYDEFKKMVDKMKSIQELAK